MDKVIVKPLEGSYTVIVVTKTSDSPFDFLTSISEVLASQNVNGLVLIDELLHSGNGEERFIEAKFEDGSFDMTSFRFVNIPKNSRYRAVACDWLREDLERLEYSDLTSIQRKMIIKGLVI